MHTYSQRNLLRRHNEPNHFNLAGLAHCEAYTWCRAFRAWCTESFGWFGGYGISGTAGYFQKALGAPAVLAYAGVFAELVASILLLFGASTGLVTLIVIAQMLAAIYLSHSKDGFFMNYFGQLPAGREGFEYNLVMIGMALLLFFAGAGRYSFDAKWELDFVRNAIGFGN